MSVGIPISFPPIPRRPGPSSRDELFPSCRKPKRLEALRREFRRLFVEVLEARLAPALFTVNSLADTSVLDSSNSSGLLTLRNAVVVENGTVAIGSLSSGEQSQIAGPLHAASGDTIQFAPALAGYSRIRVACPRAAGNSSSRKGRTRSLSTTPTPSRERPR